MFQSITVEEQRIVHDKKFWSSGGVTSGLDLCLAFIAEESGREEAGKVQLLLEYFPPSTNYAKEEQIQELPMIKSPNGDIENGMQRLPRYLSDSYFQ